MSTYRLLGAKDQPFLIAVQTDVGETVDVAVLDPDLAPVVGSPFSLDDTDGDGLYRATFTPTVVGEHQMTISSSSPTVDGLIAILDVRSSAVGVIGGGITYGMSSCSPTGFNLRWPCPVLSSLACLTAFSLEQIERWTEIATVTLFSDFCNRFPGCDNYARLRPSFSAGCFTPLPPQYGQPLGVDLWPTIRYPVIEICEVLVNGTDVGTEGWRIEGARYLVPEGNTAWPNQDLHQADGADDTWAVTVRYGRAAPALAVAARDQLMLQMMMGNDVPANGAVCTTPEGLVQVSENGRTMTFDMSTAPPIYEQARRRWRCPKRRSSSRVVDLAERTASGSRVVHVVPGDFTPAAAIAFAASGCDLQAQYDALTA